MSVPSRPASRYQRRILGWGAGVVCLLLVVGAPIYLDRVERDLGRRAAVAVHDAGFDGVDVSFSGQTATVECSRPIGDPSALVEVVEDVRGVRAVAELPDACRVRSGPGTTVPVTEPASTGSTEPDTTTTTAPLADFETVATVVSGSPQFSLLEQLLTEAGLLDVLTVTDPVTLFAPTDDAFDQLDADAVAQLRSDPALLERVLRHHVVAARLTTDDLTTGPLLTLADDELDVVVDGPAQVDGASIVDADVTALNGVVHAVDRLLLPQDVDLTSPEPLESVVATYADGVLTLDGVVRSEVERAVLLDAVAFLDPAAVADRLTTDPALGLDEPTAQALGVLVAALPERLVDGTAGFDGAELFVSGTYRTEAGRDVLLAIADEVGATATLEPRPEATVDDAVDLEAELNEFVAEHPILFEPSSAVLDDSAVEVLDEIARLALEFDGVSITIRGHTDSSGVPYENFVLGHRRAEAVRLALIERGIDEDALDVEGVGSDEPILVDGVEDKAASRRVEFRVEVEG